jgi:DNA-binding PadR family transcriptional regulator
MSTIHAVLGVLAEGDCHGYEIAAQLAERVGAGPYNSGQIHQALEIIERKGWAVGEADVLPSRARRRFTISPDGRREFGAWLERPIPPGRGQRDDVVLKMVFLAERDLPRLAQVLDERRREYVRRLAVYQRQPLSRGNMRDLVRSLVREKFAVQDEAEIEWIDRCLVQLRAHHVLPGKALAAGSGQVRKRSG